MRVNEDKLARVEQMNYGVGQKVVFCGLRLLGSTHHLPIEGSTLTGVCLKWLTKYLIIFIHVLLRERIMHAASYNEFNSNLKFRS